MTVFTSVIRRTCDADSRSTPKAERLQLLYRRPWKLIYFEAYTEQADAALKKIGISHQAR